MRLNKLIVPKNVSVKRGDTRGRIVNILVEAIGTEQTATVTLTATSGSGVMVKIDPASITKEIDADFEGETTRFGFNVTIIGLLKGEWTINWTATVSGPQDSNPANDVLTGNTKVIVVNTIKEAVNDLRAKIGRR